MKKEKTIRTYQRRTKSGKVVTVRQHTASYDAAEKLRELAKKKGAGKEFEDRKSKGMPDPSLPLEQYLDELSKRKKGSEAEDSADVSKEAKKGAEKKTTKKEPTPKKKSAEKSTKRTKAETSEPAFTAAEFKEWYRGTGSAADKKVEKALRAQLGRAGYRKFEDEAIDNYSSRGHLSMFKRVSGGSEVNEPKKGAASAKTTKDIARGSKDKENNSVLKNSIRKYSDYVKHLLHLNKMGEKDPMMGSYIAEQKKILQDLKKHKGGLMSPSEIGVATDSFAKKHKLSYEEDGVYSDKSGKAYRISTNPITGKSTLHPMVGSTLGATESQILAASRTDTNAVDDKRLSSIIWGDKSTGKSKKPTSSVKTEKSAKNPIDDPFKRARLIEVLRNKGKGEFDRVQMSHDFGEYFSRKGGWTPSVKGKALLKEAKRESDSLKVSKKEASLSRGKSGKKPTTFSGQEQLKQEMATWKKSPTSAMGKASRNNITKLLQEKKKEGYRLTKREEAFLGG